LERLPGVYAIDVDDLAVLTGFADYVFVGLVTDESPVVPAADDATPKTRYTVSVIENIKGDLGSGEIAVNKVGGLSADATRLLIMEEDYLPQVGSAYVFVACVQSDGSLLVSGKNSNTLLLIDDADSLSRSDLTVAVKATQIYDEFADAYKNEVPLERERFVYTP
jgi:hypothetical protein